MSVKNQTKRIAILFLAFVLVLCVHANTKPLLKDAKAQSTSNPPILFSISDAIKPGDTTTITGNFLNNVRRVAFCKSQGMQTDFEDLESTNDVRYLDVEDLSVVNDDFGTGLMFVFPYSENAGIYDFWVETDNGWSNPLTMNAVRPLYIDQDTAYYGQHIQIIGRNFFQSEYGIGDEESSLESIRVALRRINDENQVADNYEYTLSKENGGILSGIRVEANKSATGEPIPYANPYKITFLVPEDLEHLGHYEIFVASDGKTYRKTQDKQTLKIVEKKNQDWKTDVFGAYGDSHNGNDPFDLGVHWAQDLNYKNVEIMSPNNMDGAVYNYKSASVDGVMTDIYEKSEFDESSIKRVLSSVSCQAVSTLTSAVNNAINSLSSKGGGVVYFPEGNYYINNINFKDNVVLAGAGIDKTFLYRVGSGAGAFIVGYYYGTDSFGETITKSYNNIGICNLTIGKEEYSTYPGGFINIREGSQRNGYGEDASTAVTKNKFLVNVEINSVENYMGTERECLIDGTPIYYDSQAKTYSVDSSFGNPVNRASRAYAYSITGAKNGLVLNVRTNGGGANTLAMYEYNRMENVFCRLGTGVNGSPTLKDRYTFIENCYFDINYGGHGPSIKSRSYVAYTFTENAGERVNAINDGEALLIEPPSGFIGLGRVVSATPNTISLKVTGGKPLMQDTQVANNAFAVCITSGTGTGQYRYLTKIPTSSNDISSVYSYDLAPYENDWDILPDSTSLFTLINPIEYVTVYKYGAEDCVSTICLYSTIMDAVVSDCNLKDTGGISLNGASTGTYSGRSTPNYGIRIQNNKIEGVGATYNVGGTAYQGTGGILIYCAQTYDEGNKQGYTDLECAIMIGITVRGNTLKNIVSDVPPQSNLFPNQTINSKSFANHGIVVYTVDRRSESLYKGNLRYLVIENNSIDVSEVGIYAENAITGMIIKNNDISGVINQEMRNIQTYNADQQIILSTYTLINEQITTKLALEVGSNLPILNNTPQKDFLGWFESPDTINSGETPITKVLSYTPKTLYARFSIKGESYSIEYVLPQGATHSNPNTYTEGMELTLTDASLEGHTFNGWYTEQAFINKKTGIIASDTGDKTFYARFTPIQEPEPEPTISSISYILPIGAMHTNPNTYVEGMELTLTDANLEGYTFNGWYTEQAFINKKTGIIASDTGDKTFYARFTVIPPPQYSIGYILPSGATHTNPSTYAEGAELTLTDASLEGYTFDGWYSEQAFINKETGIKSTDAENKTFYAKFTKIEQPQESSSCNSKLTSKTEITAFMIVMLCLTAIIIINKTKKGRV